MNAKHLSQTNEWYTPKTYVERVRRTLGEIDLDPATCEHAQIIVNAKKYYTKEQDGLSQLWFGKVFLNPPYGKTCGKSNQGLWSSYLMSEFYFQHVTGAVLLVNSCTGDKWFQKLWDFPICFVNHRIHFIDSDGNRQKQATHSNVFVYFGQYLEKFRENFKDIGTIK